MNSETDSNSCEVIFCEEGAKDLNPTVRVRSIQSGTCTIARVCEAPLNPNSQATLRWCGLSADHPQSSPRKLSFEEVPDWLFNQTKSEQYLKVALEYHIRILMGGEVPIYRLQMELPPEILERLMKYLRNRLDQAAVEEVFKYQSTFKLNGDLNNLKLEAILKLVWSVVRISIYLSYLQQSGTSRIPDKYWVETDVCKYKMFCIYFGRKPVFFNCVKEKICEVNLRGTEDNKEEVEYPMFNHKCSVSSEKSKQKNHSNKEPQCIRAEHTAVFNVQGGATARFLEIAIGQAVEGAQANRTFLTKVRDLLSEEGSQDLIHLHQKKIESKTNRLWFPGHKVQKDSSIDQQRNLAYSLHQFILAIQTARGHLDAFLRSKEYLFSQSLSPMNQQPQSHQ